NPICSQTSYTNYFAYNASTIQGYQRTLNSSYAQSGYTDAQWISLLQTDINAGRPVQYAGQDPSAGGHTWVCDGYDASNNFHMNWGWGGSSDGFFSINNLATSGFNPSTYHEILVGIQPPPLLDAGVTAVVSPKGVICVSTFTPVVTLSNFGQNKLTTCNINYQIDGGTVQTYSWTGAIFTNQSVNVSLPAVTVAIGTHTLTSSTSNPNSGTDANTANDQSVGTFMYATVGFATPLVEGFESSASLPANWSTSPANDIPWQVVTTVASTGTNCVGFNNCTGDGGTDMTGFVEWLYTPPYDFSSATSASLSFDVGYVPAFTASTTTAPAKLYTDSLAVLYSSDCGTTWNQIYYKGGTALSTAPAFTMTTTLNCVAPTSSQWRTETVNLTGILGQPNVKFAFKNISDWGNWIYVDNINISSVNTTGIATTANKGGISIYPNPAHTNLYINTTENTTSISVTDIIGQTVISDLKVIPQQTQNIDISDLADGVYLVKVTSSDNQVKVLRFIKN
ncbi:MAG: C10 family peptidase, partial [Bacteroidia bacterium]